MLETKGMEHPVCTTLMLGLIGSKHWMGYINLISIKNINMKYFGKLGAFQQFCYYSCVSNFSLAGFSNGHQGVLKQW